MSRRRVLLLTALSPVLCGIVVACLLSAAWLVVGRPTPAQGEIWFRLQQVSSEARYNGSPDQPVFFIVIGSDAREGGPGGSRGDSVHVVGVNPALGAATIIGVPRDTAVPIPGQGTNKINAALQFGGLPLQAQTVSDLFGIAIPYAMVTDFDGFVAMVDEMGGIDINMPAEQNDPDSGAVFAPGPQHIDGGQALAFSRNRKDFGTGDLARSENQGLLMVSALATLRSQNTGAGGTMRLLGILGRHTEVQGMNLIDLYRFARLGLAIDPANVRNVVIPTGGGSGSDLAVGAGAAELLADFRDDAVLQTH
jgi:polyisoprenyl-teichoic acid--peptidoglycan teichoic acid transferase